MTDMADSVDRIRPRRSLLRRTVGSRLRAGAEYVVIPVCAVLAAFTLFALFLLGIGKSPATFVSLVWIGGFGTAFSWGNTLQKAAPLILTALTVAIPARIGLTIIGGEGALVLGGFAAAAAAVPFAGSAVSPLVVMPLMIAAALVTGAVWIGLAGLLRYRRGVNETISSLLLSYIAIAIMNFFVEGVLRDASNPNKPSTMPIGCSSTAAPTRVGACSISLRMYEPPMQQPMTLKSSIPR